MLNPRRTTTNPASEDPRCEDALEVTWENFGQGFLTMHCNGCHTASSQNRYGAPEDATFDTVDEAWAWADPILTLTTGDSATEPPGGGVTTQDLELLFDWLGCGTPGT